MLVIKVEVWPNGRPGSSREIGRAGLANVSRLAAVSDYTVVRVADNGRVDRGVVRRHVRSDGFWPLISRAAAPDLDRELTHSEASITSPLLERLTKR